MREKVTKSAYAKINLTLEVFPPRGDGYHGVETVMHKISLCDTVTVTPNNTGAVHVSCSKDVCAERDNLAYRAAEAFYRTLGIDGGCDICIEKVIPDKAGLAGGSADAAAVIDALAEIYGVADDGALDGICKSLGSDIVFCREKYVCAKATGRGEIILPCRPLAKMHVLIAVPDAGLSTREIYAEYDRCGVYPEYCDGITATEKLVCKLTAGESISQCDTQNSFEPVCTSLAPKIGEVIKLLQKTDAEVVRMSGSGSAVYALYRESAACKAAKSLLKTLDGLRFCGQYETLGE